MELFQARITGKNKLSIFQKAEIIRKMETDASYSNKKASDEYHVVKSAITYIMKNKDKILKTVNQRGSGRSLHEFDEAIIQRTKECRDRNGVVPTMKSICEIANQIASEIGKLSNFGKGPGPWRANKGWYARFASRVNVGYLIMGTSPSDDLEVNLGYSSIINSTGIAVHNDIGDVTQTPSVPADDSLDHSKTSHSTIINQKKRKHEIEH